MAMTDGIDPELAYIITHERRHGLGLPYRGSNSCRQATDDELVQAWARGCVGEDIIMVPDRLLMSDMDEVALPKVIVSDDADADDDDDDDDVLDGPLAYSSTSSNIFSSRASGDDDGLGEGASNRGRGRGSGDQVIESFSFSERTPTTSREEDLVTDETSEDSEGDASIDIEHLEGSDAGGDDDDEEEGNETGSGSNEDDYEDDASGNESGSGSNRDERDEAEGEIVVEAEVEAVTKVKGSRADGDDIGVPPVKRMKRASRP
ncbi:late secretory pathway protein AVL9-like [Camellia sinensis]|uniref:late secretory pathway protein AVL9-like n=1 Tax=Camellia sinensis TaxID=4442 RepID=UPI00103684DD|nr:late secretory pathway protein AVL9-like [Camellia sinensis]